MKVNFIASGRDVECGINHYTTSIESALSVSHVRTGIKSYSLDLCHYVSKTWGAIKSDSDVLHLQHEYNIFGPASICSWPVLVLLLFAKFMSDKNIVITIHTMWDKDTFGTFRWPLNFLKWIYIWSNNQLLLSAADHVFYMSEESDERLKKQYHLPSRTQLPHGVQVDTSPLSKSEARDLLNWGQKEQIVVIPGYIRPQKKYSQFVQVAEEDDGREYVVAGGIRNEKFTQYAEEIFADVPENMSRTGILDQDQFRAVFVAADLCYLPYKGVSQSGIVNWSLASGLPVFGSDIEYFQELANDTRAVQIVDSNVESVVSEIDSYFSNGDLRREMREDACRYARENSMEKIAKKHMRVYQSLTGEI